MCINVSNVLLLLGIEIAGRGISEFLFEHLQNDQIL